MKKLASGTKSISASDGFSLPGNACHRQEVKHKGKNEVSKYCIQDEGEKKKKSCLQNLLGVVGVAGAGKQRNT